MDDDRLEAQPSILHQTPFGKLRIGRTMQPQGAFCFMCKPFILRQLRTTGFCKF
jgi:hypothetical protein